MEHAPYRTCYVRIDVQRIYIFSFVFYSLLLLLVNTFFYSLSQVFFRMLCVAGVSFPYSCRMFRPKDVLLGVLSLPHCHIQPFSIHSKTLLRQSAAPHTYCEVVSYILNPYFFLFSMCFTRKPCCKGRRIACQIVLHARTI